MTQASDLYQEVILDHTKRPRNYGHLDHPTHTADGDNPVCGDKLHVEVEIEDGVIRDVKFEGQGCAISQASASVMTGQVKGKPVGDARALSQLFREVVTGKRTPDPDELGTLAVFQGVSRFPTRTKCATLAWHTLGAALEDKDQPVTTEE